VDKRNEYQVEGKTLFAANYLHFWCVIRDSQPVMLEDYLLFDKILEPEKALFVGSLQTKPTREYIKNMGRVTHVSKTVSEAGINPGDVIMHVKDADYDIHVEGKLCFKTSLRSVVAKQKGGEIHPQSDQILVVPIDDTEIRSGLLLVKTEKKKQMKGVVVKVGSKVNAVKVGDEVSYFNGIFSEVTFAGVDYSVIREEYLVGILQDHQIAAQESPKKCWLNPSPPTV
jgi:co-chaperonin GroES (HSP10)